MPTIRVAHSPDSDDAFMFYALAEGKIDTGDRRYVHELSDIESLNQRALAGELEVSAVSIHAYAYLTDRYALLASGSSMGDGYGPRLVGLDDPPADPRAAIRGRRIAVPGLRTTAYLALRLYQPDFEAVVVPFDLIGEAVRSGQAELGLLIHEGQLTYAAEGLKKVVDLGEWFYETHCLPLPLGVDVIRKNLGRDVMRKTTRLLRDSIVYGLEHREDALKYAMKFGRGIETPTADRFVGMYVNDFTVDMGRKGKDGLLALHRAATEAGLLEKVIPIEMVDM